MDIQENAVDVGQDTEALRSDAAEREPHGRGDERVDLHVDGDGGGVDGDRPTDRAVYFVNTREGRVADHGEYLTGRVVLSRVGLSVEKYELWTVVDGRTGDEIGPDQTVFVRPGEHFRATIRGTDYSSPDRRFFNGAA